MAGKNTFRSGRHSSRDGALVKTIALKDEHVKRLQCALERELSQVELVEIVEALSSFRHLKQAAIEDQIVSQDVKRTLAAITKLPPDQAVQAKNNCDETSAAAIDEALWFDCGLKHLGTEALLNPPPEQIPIAAIHALNRLNSRESVGGRPGKEYQKFIAEFALQSWLALGRTELKIWHAEAYRSPLLNWATCLFEIVDGFSDDSQVKKLLKQAQKR